MMCLTHIVEYLKNRGIMTEAYASSIWRSDREPSIALICDTLSDYRSKDTNNEPQWWSADFKQKISLIGYTIKSPVPNSGNPALTNFTLSVSFDNKTWKVVQGPLQRSESETTHELPKPVNAQFVRIDGNSLHSSYPKKIAFYYIKFYGSLNPIIGRCAASCKTKKGVNLDLMKMIFVLCK